MRRFQFPLERLLWHRQTLEERAEQALAEALRREQGLAEELSRVRGLQEAEAADVRRALATPMPGRDMHLHLQFAGALAARWRLLAAHLQTAQALSAERRAALLDRRRNREVVAQLRTRALRRYRQAAEREAQKTLDEIAGIRYVHQASQPG
jgi:flagellar export protein FliJ